MSIASEIERISGAVDDIKASIEAAGVDVPSESRVEDLPPLLGLALSGEWAPAYTYGTDDLVAGESELATGTLHFVYE